VSTPDSKALHFGALALTILVWGVGPALIRSFSLAAGAADALVIRTGSVAICCLILLPFLGGFRVALNDIPKLLLISLGMFGYFAGSIFGFSLVTSGVGGIIISTQPLLIALLAGFFGTEKIRLPTIAGLVISFAGTLYLFSGDTSVGAAHQNLVIGGLMIFVSGLFWSIYVIFSAPLIRTYGSFKIAALSNTLAAVPALGLASHNTLATLTRLDGGAIGSLAFLTLIGTLLTVSTWNYASARLKPTTVGASLYLIPVLAIAAGAVVLGEGITTTTMISGGIILLGVALAQFGGVLKPRASLGALAAVLFAVTLWGMVPVITRFLVLGISPQTVMILRVFPAGIIGLCMAIYLGISPMPWQAWLRIAIAALLGNVGYHVLAVVGAQYIPASWMGMLFGLEPVFIALFAVVIAGDRLTSWLVGGIALALIGTATLMLGNLVAPAKDVGLFGLVLVTISTMGWGIYTVLVQPVSKAYGSTQIAGITLGISAFPMLLFVSPELSTSLAGINAFQWGVIAFLVIFCTFLCTIAWNYALGHMDSALAGMFLYIQPIVAAIGGIFLLGEHLSVTLVAGGLLIITGVAVSQFGPLLSRKQTEILA
jgi:drug/metabolite transporter (DMT)-like permease